MLSFLQILIKKKKERLEVDSSRAEVEREGGRPAEEAAVAAAAALRFIFSVSGE